jgi:hypothetical protein
MTNIKNLDLWFVKRLPWPLDIHGSKLYFYRNIFLSQYRKQKYLMCIGPNKVMYRVYWGFP